MSETQTNPSKPAAKPRRRRVLFGVNTLVAVAAAVIVVVLVNWIAYRQFVRLDFTELGVYSLSPQTQDVLADLEGDYEVVTLFSSQTMTVGRRRVRDLIDEYDRASPNLDVTHIDVDVDAARYDAFTARLTDRYGEGLAGVEASIREASEAIDVFVEGVGPVLGRLGNVLENEALPSGQVRERLSRAFAAMRSVVRGQEGVAEQVEAELAAPLPNYQQLQSEVQDTLVELNTRILPTVSQWFTQAADDPAVPAAAQEDLLQAVETLDALRTPVREAAAAAREAEVPEDYQRVRSELTRGGAVIVLGPEKVRVISEQDMFLEVDPNLAEQAEQELGGVETRFLGEERLTGALVSLQLDETPMVVFVDSQQARALGPQGQFTHVASRLESLNFDARSWSPGGQMTQFGMTSPPQPAPEPEPGQAAVWVVLPQPPANPQNPMQMQGGGGAQQIADTLRGRLEAGDGVMLHVGLVPGAMMAPPDPLADLAAEWGLAPRSERIVVREIVFGEGETAAQPRFEITDWPTGLAVTEALSGMRGLFTAFTPLAVESLEDVTTWPLIAIGQDGGRTWAIDAAAIASPADLRNVAFDPEAAEDPFTPGVAAERGDTRLAVFTDQLWASDRVTTFGVIPGLGGGPGLADIAGAAYPANAELFVNTTLWLAGLEDLVATSPRVQKTRRIAAIDETTRAATITALMAGVPAASLLLGLGVYLVRRRG